MSNNRLWFAKKTAVICMIILVLCASVCSAFATDISYEIKEIGMSLNIPNNMQVITRETPEDDIVFSTFGLDYQGIMNDFENRSIYLQAADAENYLTLTVTKTITEESKIVDNYNKLSEDELNRIKDTFLAIPSYQECEEKEINGCKYLCLLVSEQTNGNYVYSQQYNTVVNGENYIVSLQAPNAQQLTNDDKATLDRIMKSVEIRKKTFFNQYGATIILIVACVIAFAGVIILFLLLYKYIKDPKRKHNNLIHQLAHEHKITETAKIPRKKLHKYMIQSEIEQEDFVEQYEESEEKLPLEEADTREYQGAVVQEDEYKNSMYGQQEIYVPQEHNETQDEYDNQEQHETQDEYYVKEQYESDNEYDAQNEESNEIFSRTTYISKNVKNEDEVVIEEFDDFGGTDYFDDVPAEEEMYAYSDVEQAVDDYSNAKREAMKRRNAASDENYENTALKILKAIGKGIISVFQTIFVVICFIVVHLKYFCINLYRLIKRKRIEKKRRKIQEEKKRRAEERRRRQREAEMHRQRENRNRGENDLVMVRSRGESRHYQGNSSRENLRNADRPRNNYDRDRQNRPYRR